MKSVERISESWRHLPGLNTSGSITTYSGKGTDTRGFLTDWTGPSAEKVVIQADKVVNTAGRDRPLMTRCRDLADRPFGSIGNQTINKRILSMENDTPIENILDDVVTVLELHTQILQQHRQAIERLFAEIAGLHDQILDKSKSPDALNSTDPKFIGSATARLKAISKTVEEKL